jgi:putative membrane protein
MPKLNILLRRCALAATLAVLPVGVAGQSNSKPSDPSVTEKPDAATPRANYSGVSPADKKFVREAAQRGLAEVELGKLATEKASSEEVKKFGQRMMDDHSKAGEQLKDIASGKGIHVPDKLSAKDQLTKDRLSKLSGAEFDKAYMTDMVKDHTQDVADFKRESNSGRDPEVKNLAAKTHPTLKDHLRQAKEIAPASHSANGMKDPQ